MTGDQLIVFGVLAATLVLFIWNRWRYDLVALGALLACALSGVVPAGEVFAIRIRCPRTASWSPETKAS